MFELFRLRRLHILKYATQLSCTLQYGHCNSVSILFGLLAGLFVNLAVCVRALISQFASIFGLVEQALRRTPFYTEWSCASSFEVVLAGQSSHFPTWASASRTLGSRCIFHFLLRRRSWRRVRLCRFCTLILIVSETAIVSIGTLPVSFPFSTISWTSLFTLFYPLILDHGACFKISISGFKVLHSQILLDTSFYHRLQSVTIRFGFLLNLHFVEFPRLSYS